MGYTERRPYYLYGCADKSDYDIMMHDLRHMSGYLPVKEEAEYAIDWLDGVIGNGWKQRAWLHKWGGRHIVRYRFGDVQCTLVYLNDKSWRKVPLRVWYAAIWQDKSRMDDACWDWVKQERKWCDASAWLVDYNLEKRRGGKNDIHRIEPAGKKDANAVPENRPVDMEDMLGV